MKKLLAVTLIVTGMLIAGSYSNTVYGEETNAWLTQTGASTLYAWGIQEMSGVHYEGPPPFTATMTHTHYYLPHFIIVDIDDDHLKWKSTMFNDYMIKWTNISVWASGSSTNKLVMQVTECADVQRIGGTETIETSYAVMTPSVKPGPGDFVDAEDFKSLIAPLDDVNSHIVLTEWPAWYDKDLWARVIPDGNTRRGTYEDVFYITFNIIP